MVDRLTKKKKTFNLNTVFHVILKEDKAEPSTVHLWVYKVRKGFFITEMQKRPELAAVTLPMSF